MISSAINSLYIHVPFCDGKCDYCAFYSGRYNHSKADKYLDSLSIEIDLYLGENQKLSPQTIYIGGGTPSVLDVQQMKWLLDVVNDRIDISQLTEWTVEMNPGNFDDSLPGVLLAGNVNRISLGAQIFDDFVLKSIGRRHTVADIVDAVKLLRSAGIENYNIDLISSLPGVSKDLWISSIEQAIDLEPAHLAVYNFSVESGTVMEQRYNSGSLPDVSDEQQLESLAVAAALLDSVGYKRYEVSNYSLSGFESKHNLDCWRGNDYIGFGPVSSSRVRLRRWMNNADLDSYIFRLDNHKLPLCEEELLSPDVDLAERLMFNFRLVSGVNLDQFMHKYSLSPEQVLRLRKVLVRLVAEGLLTWNEGWCYPTARGLDLADYIAGEAFATLAK